MGVRYVGGSGWRGWEAAIRIGKSEEFMGRDIERLKR